MAIFARLKGDLASVARELVGEAIKLKPAHAQHGGVLRGRALAARERLHAGEQFAEGVGLGEIVVAACAQALHAIGDRAARELIDAMDALSPKCGLIAEAVNRKLRVVTVGGCAGRLDGTRLKVTDLRDSRDDPLMMLVRKRLRQNFDFPRGKAPFGVSCVWSDEPFTQPADCAGLPGGEIPEGEDLRPNCEWGYGTASHVAGAFGLAAAGEALRLALLPQE